MDLPDPGIEPRSPAVQVDPLPPELSGEKPLVPPLGIKPVSPAVEAQILTTGQPNLFYHTSILFKPPLPLGKGLGASLAFQRPPFLFHLVCKESSGGGGGGELVCLHWNLLDGKGAMIGPSALPYLEAAYAAPGVLNRNKAAGSAG